MDYRTLLSCISVIRARGVPVIVRAQTGNYAHTKRILEMGVDGIIFPNIATEEEARAAIASCLYPPEGVRGFGPLGAADYGFRDTDTYIRESGGVLAIFLQILNYFRCCIISGFYTFKAGIIINILTFEQASCKLKTIRW